MTGAAEVTFATSLWLIQWMRPGMDVFAFHNVVIAVTGSTTHRLGFFSDPGESVHTCVELLLCFAVAA